MNINRYAVISAIMIIVLVVLGVVCFFYTDVKYPNGHLNIPSKMQEEIKIIHRTNVETTLKVDYLEDYTLYYNFRWYQSCYDIIVDRDSSIKSLIKVECKQK